MPPPPHKRTLPVLATGCVVAGILLLAGYVVFVQTTAGQWLDYAGYFGRGKEAPTAGVFDGRLLGAVSPLHILLAGGVVALAGMVRRQPLTGLVAAGAAIVAIFGAEWFKAVLPYPGLVVPDGTVPAYFDTGTYPSGHTTVGSSLAFAALLAMPVGWMRWGSLLAGIVSTAFATGVLLVGWHRPSDAVGGILWSGLCVGAGALGLLAFRKKNPAVRPLGIAWPSVLGVCTVGLVLLVWGISGNLASYGARPGSGVFLGWSALIVAAAMGTAGWLGYVLSPLLMPPSDRRGR